MIEADEKLVLFSPQVEIFTPFAGHVDASRLNMNSKQILQTVISKNTETPLIIDKDYKKVSQINSPFAEFALDDGIITYSDHETIIIYYNTLGKINMKSTPPQKKLINNALTLKYKAGVGVIKKGDLIFDYTNMEPKTLIPKIGYRAKILFSSFYGYTADDAMVISEGFAKKSAIEYSHKLFIPITKEWKYLRNPNDDYFYEIGQTLKDEAYLKYFPIDTSDHFMAEIHNLSEQQSMFFTKSIPGIKEGDVISIKVHKNTEKSFNLLKEEYMYTPGLINEIERMYNNNVKVKLGTDIAFQRIGLSEEEASKYSQELFDKHYSVPKFPKFFESKLKDDFQLDPNNVDFLIEVTVLKTKATTRGDKFTNIFAGKGTVSMIIPDSIMPKDPVTNLPVDIIFNPLGIFGRNNWGVIFELGLSKIIEDIEILASDIKNGEFNPEKAEGLIERISFIEEKFIRRYDNKYARDIREFLIPGITSAMLSENFEPINKLVDDIIKNKFYLFVPNFPGISYTSFYSDFLKPYGIKFNISFDKSKVNFDKDLIRWLREEWDYTNETLGGEIYETTVDAFTGTNYMLKLYHTSYSKFTTVSLANSYSKITGQPVRGRKKTGGQHISWQTLAALLGHKENNGILKELYTIKSDAPLKDKEKFLMQYITHGKYNLKPKYTSLTKRAINSALKMLGMKLED